MTPVVSKVDGARVWWRTSAWLLLLPLMVALWLRLLGVNHGEPDMIFHPDVAKQIEVARAVYQDTLDLRAMFKGDFRLALYPCGMPLLMGYGMRAVEHVVGPASYGGLHKWYWALGMRCLGIVFFVATLAISLVILRRKWGNRAALVAGILVAVEPFHSQFNHYAMNDAPLAGILLLAWALSLLMPDEKRMPIFSCLTGLAVGIGFGIKYQGVLGMIFPGIAWLALLRARAWHISLLSAVAVALGAGVGVWLTCPLLWQDPDYFLAAFPQFMSWQANIMERPIPFSIKLQTNLLAIASFLSVAGHWMLVVSALAAAGYCVWRKFWHCGVQVLSALLFSGLLFVAILCARDWVRPNDLIPVFVFLIPVSSFWFVCDGGMDPLSRWLVRAGKTVILAVIPVFFYMSLMDALALARVDTRVSAKDWCRVHLPAKVTVLSERYALPVGRSDIRDVTCRFAAERAVDGNEAQAFRGVDYVIISSLAWKRFFNPGTPYYAEKARAVYSWLDSNCTRVAAFSDREMWYAQPEISIYKIRKNEAENSCREDVLDE